LIDIEAITPRIKSPVAEQRGTSDLRDDAQDQPHSILESLASLHLPSHLARKPVPTREFSFAASERSSMLERSISDSLFGS